MSVWAFSPELLAAGGAFGLGALAIAGARDTGGLSILAWPGGSMWRAELVEQVPPLMLAGVEAMILALTLAFAWRSRRTWPSPRPSPRAWGCERCWLDFTTLAFRARTFCS